jgi:YVTN family beta-propeller protein
MSGCKKKDDDNDPINPPVKDDAVYIINEGPFGASGTGTIDFYSPDADSSSNDIFGYVNVFPLGNVVQSMTIFGEKGYICVNNSQKMVVVNMADFVDFGTTNGLMGPRFFLGVNSTKGYVSDWFSDKVKVIDLTTLAVIDSIPTGAGPEQMILENGKVFVTNVGGWGNDSTVTVIDANTNAVITTIEVGLNPNSIKKDADGKLWVLCGGTVGPDFQGGTADDRAGSLVRINPATMAVDKSLPMASADHPVKLAVNGDGSYLYYLKGTDGYNGKVYKMKNTDVALPAAPIVNKEFYGLGINPVSGDIYGGFAPDFTQNGTMYRFNNLGLPLSTKTTGIAPNGFAFY